MHNYSGSLDYEAVNRTLTFTNSTELTVSVPISPDEVTESMEFFRVQLTNVSPPNIASITVPEAVINIVDQESEFEIELREGN